MSTTNPEWFPCPFCATPIKLADTQESHRHAGNTCWHTTIIMKCGCFQERWTRSDYGTKEGIEEDARRVWNTRP